MKQLPIGIQDFKELRSRDNLYIDKTKQVYQLATENKYYFLSRPRRFGKSLLLSTLKSLFEGEKSLFQGLWIEDQWDWNQTNPVVEFKFNNASYKLAGLDVFLSDAIKQQAAHYGITINTEHYPNQFEELIQKLARQQGQVVVLVDEYDKPIIDYLHDVPQATANREILKNFYSVLKPSDAQIRMVFITGVSKFSRVSIFSELNNLLDLTMHHRYADLLGYTQEELIHFFDDRIEALSPKFGDKSALLEQIQRWYNGYTWDTINYVYNPFSILSFFDAQVFRNFWFETGTPTFLIKLLRKNNLYDVENIQTSDASLGSYELGNISPETLLFQTGYITIKKALGFGLVELGYPNQEVRESMLKYLLADYVQQGQGRSAAPALLMTHALVKGKTEDLKAQINALLHSIPYELHQSNEAYYHTIMHLAFSLIGVHIQSEIHVAKGRLDSIVQTADCIYIFEFKVNSDAQTAISQIKAKEYAAPYVAAGKRVVLIGVSFNTDLKEVDSWLVEEMVA